MKNTTITLTPEEVEQILFWIKPRIQRALNVTSDQYTAQFLAPRLTPAQIDDVHAARFAEVDMLQSLVDKLEA